MSASPLVILCYHKIGPEAEEGRSLNVEPARLESHVRYFQRRGYRFVRGADLVGRWSEPTVCLTFDDAYASTLNYGREVLNRCHVTGVFYVVSSLVGDASRWDGDKARPLADEATLKQALAEGFELGNHTATHPALAEHPDAVSLEVGHCAAYLAGLGVRGESFCYPYGSISTSVQESIGRAGYKVGMALGGRPARLDDPLLALPRTVIAFSDALPMLLYRLYIRPKLKRR